MLKILDYFFQFLAILVSGMVLAGGGIVQIGKAKIEFSALDLWVLLPIFLYLFFYRWSKNYHFRVWSWLLKLIEWLKSPNSYKYILSYLFSTISYCRHTLPDPSHLRSRLHQDHTGHYNLDHYQQASMWRQGIPSPLPCC